MLTMMIGDVALILFGISAMCAIALISERFYDRFAKFVNRNRDGA